MNRLITILFLNKDNSANQAEVAKRLLGVLRSQNGMRLTGIWRVGWTPSGRPRRGQECRFSQLYPHRICKRAMRGVIMKPKNKNNEKE